MSRLVSLVSRSECPPRPADELLTAWHAASGTALPFKEWCDPTARNLADMLQQKERGPRQIDSSIVAFAQARAGADHGAEEVASDLTALVTLLADAAHPSIDPVSVVARALAAWAAEQVAVVSNASCIDPVTGLVNGGFLRARLRELHAQCEALAIAPPMTFGSLVVQLDLGGIPVPDRMSARVAVGKVLRSVFRTGETVAALSRTRLVAVMPAYALDRAQGDLREALAERPELEEVPIAIDRRMFGNDVSSTWRWMAGTPVGA